MKKLNAIISLFALPLLAGCMPSLDLQGNDPDAYYTAHPIENKVETLKFVHKAQFENDANTLSKTQINELKKQLEQVAPKGVEAINLQVFASDSHKKPRLQYLRKTLHDLGYAIPITVSSGSDVGINNIEINITYAAVVAPDCPDWKKSPVTTYSNSTAANFGCASAVNLGLMIDDPHDLVMGKGSAQSETERSGKVVSDYRSGGGAAAVAAPAAP